MSNTYLNFAEISTVPFKDILDWLNIPYQQNNGELKGEGFIINVSKNLFFEPKGQNKGSVINFLSNIKGIDLRTAALEIKTQFQSQAQDPKKELPNLLLEHHKLLEPYGITEEIAKDYEVGFVRQKSIFAGKIAFKVFDENGKHTGYIAYDNKTGNWLFPKNFKRTVYNIHRVKEPFAIVVPSTFDVFHLLSIGYPNTVALMAKSMTEEQERQLKAFKHILLLHSEPDNIVIRLSKHLFIQAPRFNKNISELSEDDIKSLL